MNFAIDCNYLFVSFKSLIYSQLGQKVIDISQHAIKKTPIESVFFLHFSKVLGFKFISVFRNACKKRDLVKFFFYLFFRTFNPTPKKKKKPQPLG